MYALTYRSVFHSDTCHWSMADRHYICDYCYFVQPHQPISVWEARSLCPPYISLTVAYVDASSQPVSLQGTASHLMNGDASCCQILKGPAMIPSFSTLLLSAIDGWMDGWESGSLLFVESAKRPPQATWWMVPVAHACLTGEDMHTYIGSKVKLQMTH